MGLLPGSNGLSQEERKGLEDSLKTRGKGSAEVHMKRLKQLEQKIEQVEQEKAEAEKEEVIEPIIDDLDKKTLRKPCTQESMHR